MLGKFLIGSNNYNLDLPESDKDYKIIVAPTFEDLFYNKTLNKQIDDNTSQVDFRFFFQKLLKGNPNYIEMLFSQEKIFYDERLEFLFSMSKIILPSILRLKWSNFVSAVKGLAYNSIKHTDKESKMLARCMFFLHLLETTYKNDGILRDEDWVNHNFRAIRSNKELQKEAKAKLPELFNFDKKLEPRAYDQVNLLNTEELVKNVFKEYLTNR